MKWTLIFQGSIPVLYDQHLGPLIFVPYAMISHPGWRTYSAAKLDGCGTGVLTRALVASRPENVSFVATDLNQPMLDHASTQLLSTRVN